MNVLQELNKLFNQLERVQQTLEESKLMMAEQKGRIDALEKTVNSLVRGAVGPIITPRHEDPNADRPDYRQT